VEERVKQLEEEVESLKRQIAMFINFVDRTSKFMVVVGGALEELQSKVDQKPKLLM
jgi:hypothetical protein